MPSTGRAATAIVLGGEAEAGAEAFGGIGTAAIVAIFGIFAILVLEFGSFRSTLIVLTVVPLGCSAAFMLLITGNACRSPPASASSR
jgi:multidrug efflux pump subunit AcrB